jgi:hypothetical protein
MFDLYFFPVNVGCECEHLAIDLFTVRKIFVLIWCVLAVFGRCCCLFNGKSSNAFGVVLLFIVF